MVSTWWSMDNNLASTFSSPGYGNLHFVHRGLLALSKLSKSAELNDNDLQIISEIEVLISTGAISEYDPVRVIFIQIDAFIKLKKESQ